MTNIYIKELSTKSEYWELGPIFLGLFENKMSIQCDNKYNDDHTKVIELSVFLKIKCQYSMLISMMMNAQKYIYKSDFTPALECSLQLYSLMLQMLCIGA